jgi:hypothetical protein
MRMSRESLLREKERIERSLAELDRSEKEEAQRRNISEKSWDRQHVWIIVSQFNDGNCMSNATARVNVYLTEEHAMVCKTENDALSKVPIGSGHWVWIELENKNIGEGMH